MVAGARPLAGETRGQAVSGGGVTGVLAWAGRGQARGPERDHDLEGDVSETGAVAALALGHQPAPCSQPLCTFYGQVRRAGAPAGARASQGAGLLAVG